MHRKMSMKTAKKVIIWFPNPFSKKAIQRLLAESQLENYSCNPIVL